MHVLRFSIILSSEGMHEHYCRPHFVAVSASHLIDHLNSHVLLAVHRPVDESPSLWSRRQDLSETVTSTIDFCLLMTATRGSPPTPALLRRIYRQVLRYAGSAVLYAHPARPNLRALYRPEFDVWMNKVKEGERKAIAARPEWEEFSRRGKVSTLPILRNRRQRL